MTASSAITHATFVIERAYDASLARLYKAFTDPAARRRWFIDGEGWTIHEHSFDIRVGGRESSRFSPPGADMMITNDTVFLDIAPEDRVIFAYAMTIDGKPLSSSLTTVEFRADGAGSRLIFTEQGAYIGGQDDVVSREAGTRELLDALAVEVAREAA